MIASLQGRERIMAVQRDGVTTTTSSVRARSNFAVDDGVCAMAFVVPRRWGSAPERNRARRRLRHAAREVDRRLPLPAGHHLIRPRHQCLELPFDVLVSDLTTVLFPPEGHIS